MSDLRPHFLLNGLAGWRAASLQGTALTNAGNTLSLQLLPGAVRPIVDPAGSFGGLELAIGVAVDSEERVYILDGQACLLKRFDPCRQQFVTLPCIGGQGSEPRELWFPHGLAVSCRNNIYIADTGNCRVQIFAIEGLAMRAIWGPFQVRRIGSNYAIQQVSPKVEFAGGGSECSGEVIYPQGTWRPWDVSVSSRNWVYVSDYENGLIHVFDAHGCWTTAYNGAGPTNPPLVKPTRITLDSAGRIYVLQENVDYVVVLATDGSFEKTVSQPADLPEKFCPVAVAVDSNGQLCLSDCVTRKMYFYQPDGDGGWCPGRCASSREIFANSLIFDSSGNALFADGAQRVCQLVPQAAFPPSGYYYSCALDSRTYRCQWHRVVLGGCVPAGASVRVDTFTADSQKTFEEVEGLPESRWATAQTDADTTSCEWDCLTQSPPGRYLWLRLTLAGNGSASPALEKVKVYYPRASSLQYLPAVYREDPVSADFLARFLSIFDTLRGRTSHQITDIASLFGPMSTPARPPNAGGMDFLSWLAGWLGLSLQSNWPVHKRRELVRQAHRLFALRGTREGLKLQLELYTGYQPRILELFRLRRWLIVGNARLGDQSTLFGKDVLDRLQVGVNSKIGSFEFVDYGDPSLDLFNAYAYKFIVILPRWPGATESDQLAIQQIIDMAKPAHTLAELRWDEPRFRIGIQSFLGVDTVLAKLPVGVIEGQGTLGYDTVLGQPDETAKRPSSRMGRSSRIGCNTVLD